MFRVAGGSEIGGAVCEMRIAWLQPWLRRGSALGTPSLAAPAGRWPFLRRHRRGGDCARSAPGDSRSPREANSPQRVPLPLRQHLDVNRATAYLRDQLACDGWHVAGHHDHQWVVQLTRGGVARYCVAYDCSPAVEKAVCHGSRAWALMITPLHGADNLSAARVMAIKAGLGELHA